MSLLTNLISYWKLDGNSTDTVASNDGTDTGVSYLGLTPVTDDFNSYSDGNLNGNGGWSGDTAFQVQGSVVREGSKAVSASSASPVFIDKNGTSMFPNGQATFYFRRTTTTGILRFLLFDTNSSGGRVHIYIDDNGNVNYYNASTIVQLGSYSTDTWYSITVQWRISDKKARYSFNGGTYTAWDTTEVEFTNGLSYCRVQVSGTGTSYLDYIAESDVSVLTGKINQGASFNGVTSKIVGPSLGSIAGSQDLSIACWFKTTQAPTNNPTLFGARTVTPILVLRLTESTNGKVGFTVRDSNSTLITAESTSTYNDGNWHYAVGVKTNGNIELFIDGASVDSNSATFSGNFNDMELSFGDNVGDFYFGSVDEVGLWNRALSSGEISQLYNAGAGLPYPLTPTVSPFPMFLMF